MEEQEKVPLEKDELSNDDDINDQKNNDDNEVDEINDNVAVIENVNENDSQNPIEIHNENNLEPVVTYW